MSLARVTSVGARTPLGLDAVQTGFLLRAGFPAVAESPLAGPSGDAIAAGFVPVIDARTVGPERLVALARPALLEAAGSLRGPAVEVRLSIDPGTPAEAEARARLEAMVRDALPGSRVTVSALGEAGAVASLPDAIRALALREADAVVIGGVHSDHDPRVISALAARGALFSPDNLDARIPGEAAAFFVIAREASGAGEGGSRLASLLGYGLSHQGEDEGDERPAAPALALWAAVKEATQPLRDRGVTAGWMWTDLCHEARRLREWQSVFVRAQAVLGRPYRLDSPAQRMGHLGAAALPLFVATAVTAWRHGFAPSPIALATAGSDAGDRAALLLSAPGAREDVKR